MAPEILIPQEKADREIRRLSIFTFRKLDGCSKSWADTDNGLLTTFKKEGFGTMTIEVPKGHNKEGMAKLHCTNRQLKILNQAGFKFEYPLNLPGLKIG
jgi:hypothetical protein